MILRFLAGALALVVLALATMPAQARHVRHGRYHRVHHHHVSQGPMNSGCAGTTYDNDGRMHCAGGGRGIFPSPWEGRGRASRRAYVRHVPARNNAPATPARGLTRICEAGHCGTVVSWAADKFAGVFRDFLTMGYNIGTPGCYSPTGHMRHSLHHWGGACDLFNQVARNRTALRQPPPAVQIEVASRHGLTSGCIWRSPDCGHFDLSGISGARASVHRHPRGKGRRFLAAFVLTPLGPAGETRAGLFRFGDPASLHGLIE